jgi:hypothetical protein
LKNRPHSAPAIGFRRSRVRSRPSGQLKWDQRMQWKGILSWRARVKKLEVQGRWWFPTAFLHGEKWGILSVSGVLRRFCK